MHTAILIYAAILCSAAFEYRTGDLFSLFPFQVAAQNTIWPTAVINPANLPGNGGLLLNSTAARPYSERELSAAGLFAQYSSAEYGGQLSWSSFGADFYRENIVSFKAGYRLFSFISAGISGSLYKADISLDNLEREIYAGDTDAGLLLAPCSWLGVSFMQTNIITLINKKKEDVLYPSRSAGITVKPATGFSLSWNITSTPAGIVNSFAAAANPLKYFTVQGGYSREDSSLAAAFGVMINGFAISYGLRYHQYLGYTHSAGITFAPHTITGSLDYGRTILSQPEKKRDIRSATIDDLREIDGLSPRSANRIILYRDRIGPVTEKALVQIGMSREEIAIIESNFFGLQRTAHSIDSDKKPARKKFLNRPPKSERIKHRFREMIASGIPSTRAITYSELCESADEETFTDTLEGDRSLTDEQKVIIKSSCSGERIDR